MLLARCSPAGYSRQAKYDRARRPLVLRCEMRTIGVFSLPLQCSVEAVLRRAVDVVGTLEGAIEDTETSIFPGLRRLLVFAQRAGGLTNQADTTAEIKAGFRATASACDLLASPTLQYFFLSALCLLRSFGEDL